MCDKLKIKMMSVLASCCARCALLLAVLVPLAAYLLREHPMARGMSPILTPRSSWGYSLDEIPSQVGRTVLITGANAGLGFSSAKLLVQKGADVVMACRSAEKCDAAAARLRKEIAHGGSVTTQLDLASLRSVQSAAKKFISSRRLDA